MGQILSVVMEDDRPDTSLRCTDKSLTQQHLAKECDINEIIKKFEKTGVVTHVKEASAQYGDFSAIPDFHAAMGAVRAAEAFFMALPANVRERFDNDPGKLMSFVADSKNRAEAKELGLLSDEAVKADFTAGAGDTPVQGVATPPIAGSGGTQAGA